jgi:hypothetical protein
MKVSLQHAVFGDHVNKTVVTERVDATNGYLESDWKQVSTSQITQNISLVHSELVSVFSKRLCYRVKVKKADTNEPYTIYSDAKCAYAGNNSSKTFPPTNLRVTAQGTATDPEIKIMFDDNARGETYFAIVRNEQGKTPEAYQVTGVAGDASDHVLFDRNSEPPTPINEQYYSNSSTSKLKPGTNYCYKLKTSYVSSQGSTPQYSPFSNEACTTTLGTSTTPPTTLTPPTNLTTPTLGPTALILTWIDTTTTETGFDVERKTGTSGTYTKLSQSPAKSGSGSTGSYISSGLTPSTLYCYRVRAVQNTTYSAYTPDYCITTKPATTVTPPSIPTNLSVTLPTTNPSTTLNISFKDTSTNETGFEIERKTGAGGTYTQLTTLPLSAGSGTTPTYTSTLLSPSTTYCYRVRALGTTNSAYTADVCTTTAATPSSTLPTPPTSLTVTNPTTNPATSLQISWKDNSTNETGFDLRRKVGPATSSNPIAGLNQQSKAGSGSTITITSTGLTTKTQYCYQIAAKPTTAQSVYTPWVCGVTK